MGKKISKKFAKLNFLEDKDRVDSNSLSLTRSTAFFITMFLSAGFILTLARGNDNPYIFLTYPLGVTICFAPALFNRFLSVIQGKLTHIQMQTEK